MSVSGVENFFDNLKKKTTDFKFFVENSPWLGLHKVSQDALLDEVERIGNEIIDIGKQDPEGEVVSEKLKAIMKILSDTPPSLKSDMSAIRGLREFKAPFYDKIQMLLFNGDALKVLSRNEKELFCRLILIKDVDELNKLCQEKNLLNLSLVKDLNIKKVFEMMSHTDLSKKMIKKFVHKSERNQFLQNILQGIPNEKMSEKDKMDFVETHFSSLSSRIGRVAYDESPPALQKQDRITRIEISEYRAALNKAQHDYSDYVVLTNGLLQSLAKESLKRNKSGKLSRLFNKIEENYFNLNYEQCVKHINEVCKLLLNGKMLTPQDVEFIKLSYKNCTEVNKSLNYSRRFYEARLAQYIVGHACQPEKLESLQNLCAWLKDIGADTLPTLSRTSSPEKIEQTLNIIAELNWPEVLINSEVLKNDSPKWQTRDRILRPGFMVRREEIPGSRQGESSLSMNLAGMKANAPNFLDFIAKAPIRNRTVDVILPGKKGYSSENQRNRSPFVASLSGHVYFFVAMLTVYADYLREDLRLKGGDSIHEILDRELSNLLSIYVGVYVKRGYHSFHEVLDCLKEPVVTEFFKNNYYIDIVPLLDGNLLKLAQNDTLAYTKGLALKSELHAELGGKYPEISKSISNKRPLAIEPKRQADKDKRLEAQRAEQNGAAASQGPEERLREQREKSGQTGPKKFT